MERQETGLLLFRAHDGTMLVAAIQGLIRAFHKDLPPFDKAGGGEGRHGTNDDFLEKGSVHWLLRSMGNAIKTRETRSVGASVGGNRPPLQSPETELAGLHPQSQEQVGGSVGKNARSQAAAAVGHNVVEQAADEGREQSGREDQKRMPQLRSQEKAS